MACHALDIPHLMLTFCVQAVPSAHQVPVMQTPPPPPLCGTSSLPVAATIRLAHTAGHLDALSAACNGCNPASCIIDELRGVCDQGFLRQARSHLFS